jgi:hypothetical protein
LNSYRLIFSLIAIGLIAGFVAAVATKLVTVPEHDEFAYLGNALYWSGLHPASGMSFGSENYSVTFSERPPLFWWFMTSLFSLGANPYSALLISPLFTALNAIVVTLFAYELTGELKYGIFAGIFVAVSGFAASVGAHILSDPMGSFFAVLAMYSFYQYFFKDRRPFAILLGTSIGLGLVARDEDLITLVLLIILWILFVPRTKFSRKLVYLLLFGVIVGIPLKLFGLIGTMQLISNLATPLVFDGWPLVVAAGFFITYIAYASKTRTRLAELGSAFFAFFVAMLPFFFDNYTLGNIEYYIAGKGILARPVAHLMMIPLTGNVGASLSTTARASDWLDSTPSLLSIPALIFAVVGGFYLFRYNKKNFIFLLLWTVVSFGYVVGTANLEDRFLLIAFAPIMILAGIGLGYVWKKNYFIGAVSAAISFPLADIIPRAPISISDMTIVSALTSHSTNWLYIFLPTITLSSPRPVLSLALLSEGFISLPLAIATISIGTYLVITQPKLEESRSLGFAQSLASLPIGQENITQISKEPQSGQRIEQEHHAQEEKEPENDIEIIEGKTIAVPSNVEEDNKENPRLSRTWTFQDPDTFEEELGWLFSDLEGSENKKDKVHNSPSNNDA